MRKLKVPMIRIFVTYIVCAHAFKVYPWQSCDDLHDKKEKTDRRREELLELLYNNTSSEVEGIENYHKRHTLSVSGCVGCNA